MPDPKPLYDLGETLSKGEASTIHRRWMQERPQDCSDHVRKRLEVGLVLPATRYLEARAEMLRTFLLLRSPRIRAYCFSIRGSVEALAGARSVLFDKTGTLTTGELELVEVVSGERRQLLVVNK
ncbi:hypothetical protein [Modicisalibacter luteus]|uniref:hypothetical protein n=1 Tax=Modicisalibacter luteus TaxID=453962 RepID=UPI001B7F938B|nr:hypothetical protein [Halomonas lutea]